MSKTAIGPKESFQLVTGVEGVQGQSKLFEFARVAPSSGVVTFYRGSGDNTTGAIYLNGIDYVNMIVGTPKVGNTATTTVSAMPVVQYVNGPTTVAIVKTETAAIIYDFMIVGISFGN